MWGGETASIELGPIKAVFAGSRSRAPGLIRGPGRSHLKLKILTFARPMEAENLPYLVNFCVSK